MGEMVMGRPPKDGKYVNFYMDSNLFDKLVKVSEVTGKTKTFVLEEALRQYIEPYLDENGEVNATKAIYVPRKCPCLILAVEQVVNRKYYRILLDGEILTVRAYDIVLKR